MKKWELARYLIDAKKCVDSLLFLACHVKEISHLNLREYTNDKLSKMYINLRTVYCACFSNKERRQMYAQDPIMERTLYEADKNYAHKDPEYDFRELESWESLTSEVKERVIHCREVCAEYLPDGLTLDFVTHDPLLYRILHGIDREREEELMKMMHPGWGQEPEGTPMGKTFKVFQDTEQIKSVKNSSDYAAILNAGLTQRETLQTLQDGFLKMNVLFKTDSWVSINPEKEQELKDFMESIGLGDLY